MRFRSFAADGLAAYLNELRPRMLAVHLDTDRVRLHWWVPTWAIEEPLRFLMRLAPIAVTIAPDATRRLLQRTGLGDRFARAADGTRGDLWRALDDLFSESDRDLLALPDDLPFVDVRTRDVHVYVGQTRL